MATTQRDKIPVMDYRQYRRARRLVHECCNYDCGNCLALDRGRKSLFSTTSTETMSDKIKQPIKRDMGA